MPKKNKRMLFVHNSQVFQFYCEDKSKFRPEQNDSILDIPFLVLDNSGVIGQLSKFR